MLVLVHLHHGIQSFLEGISIGSKPDHGQKDVSSFARLIVTTDLKDLGNHARVDIVSGCGAGVASEDCEVGTGNAQSRTTIVSVPGAQVLAEAIKFPDPAAAYG